jgi:hypothetical protein
MLQLFVGLAILRRIRGALFLIIVVCGWHIITLSRTMLVAGITRTPLLILLYQGIFVVWLIARRHELIRERNPTPASDRLKAPPED